MFVRTNASRQNCRLGRSISRLSCLSEPLSRSRLGSLPSSSSSSSACSPSPHATTRLLSTRQPSPPWQRPTSPVSARENTSTAHLSERTFATAVSDLPITVANTDLSKIYNIRPFNSASSQLVTLAEPERAPPNTRVTSLAVPGEVDAGMSVYEACVRVGKLERARIILIRFEKLRGVQPELLMEMHNLYLEACVRQLKADPGFGKAEELHAWYEQHVHSPTLPQTAETIAYMLKASLLTTATEGTRLTRLIKRYMDMVPPDQGLDVLYCTDILSDLDIAAITKLYPQFNVADFEADFDLSESLPEDSGVAATSSETIYTSDDGSIVPKVLETPQKGSGLHHVQSTLRTFNQMRDGYDISLLPHSERREFQSGLERDCIEAAVQRWREVDENLRAMGMNTSLTSSEMGIRLWHWHQDLEAWYAREFELVHTAEQANPKSEAEIERCQYGPILMQSTPSRLAAIVTLSVLNTFAFGGIDRGVPLSSMIANIARVAEEDLHHSKYQEALKLAARNRRLEYIRKKQAQADGQIQNDGHDAVGDEKPAQNDGHEAAGGETPVQRLSTAHPFMSRERTWPLSIRTKIAAVLLSGLAEVAKVKVVRENPVTKRKVVSMQPAFTHCHQNRKGRQIGMVLAHPALSESMRKEPRADFLARHLPMVVRPDPWVKFHQGGYIESPVPLVRIKSGEKDQKLYAQAALARGDMEQIMKGLDVLGKTGWRVNRPVFDVFLEVWNTGEAIAKIPPLYPVIQMPEEPDASASPTARRMWMKAVKQVQNLKASYHSVRCFMNFQIEIARAYRDQEFFFPHNIDFRGRAYPVPTYLNHMGADHIRGLLRFSKGKMLGEKGLKWLKVHLANVHGFDKASLSDRAAYADDNMANVIDSATNPLKGSRWWLKAEDPWQCLATCFELNAAMKLPDPTTYISSLPVHQDGTCNGLQHYAALGGDTWGARQVNLIPGDKPADVYSAVADLVILGIDDDVKLLHPIAKAMVGKIKRKIVKQTVMTNVYGVTFSGAKKQVLKQIIAHYPDFEKDTGISPSMAASYTATRIFKALATMFKGAHDIQHWLGEIGSRVCRALTAEQLMKLAEDDTEPASGSTKEKKITSLKDVLGLCRSTIIWTTPLRMPVVQPYRNSQGKLFQTCMQSLILKNPDRFDPVNRRKQLQAFPPNFIHSLDASHMLLSALECEESGLDFAAVHDSFWTHAADVDVMNRVLRDAFIRIHSEDVIERLHSEFETRYQGGLYLAQIDKSSAVGQAIVQWRKSMRKKHEMTGRDEVVLEKRRLDLLNSSDPAERKMGEEMVTAASIYGKIAPEPEASIVREDLAGTALGSLSGTAGADAKDEGIEGMSDGEAGDDIEALAEDAEIAAADEAAATAAQAVADEVAGLAAFAGRSSFALTLDPQKQPEVVKKQDRIDYVTAWLPLSFPAVPDKGDFDVQQLKESAYFFS